MSAASVWEATDEDRMKPERLLRAAAQLIEKMDFVGNVCAVDIAGKRVEPSSAEAAAYCISGALRVVSGHEVDGSGDATEVAYLLAAESFCRYVGTSRVMDWADEPGRTREEAVATMMAAADAAAASERKRQ